MISPAFFVESLKQNGIEFFTGVPDSLLKNICAYITGHTVPANHIIAANEGAAVGLAAGYHLATGKIPVVYMQNSGIGNMVNPLMSLTDKDVYHIPLLLLIGWRGEPGVKDEPQHVKQGKVTLPLLETMGIRYAILPEDDSDFTGQLQDAVSYIQDSGEPFAFIVRKNGFGEYKFSSGETLPLSMTREEAIREVLSKLDSQAVLVSTTGMISRELFELREAAKEGHEKDFLTVGSMGHASQIALGIALQKKDRPVYCFDGDGATLMHMGSLGITGSRKPANYFHIVFNNGSHDSVGGQPTVGFQMDFPMAALASGYRYASRVSNQKELLEALDRMKEQQGPVLLEIRVKKGARKDLGRPTTTPVENKKAFMAFLKR